MANTTASISLASVLGQAPASPLNVPEILAEISSYLSPIDIYKCLFVNKSFHAVFIRLFWRYLRLGPQRQTPFVTVNSVRSNAHHVQSVHVTWESTRFCAPYLSFTFPILDELRINILGTHQPLSLNKEPSDFLSRHRDTIRVLYLAHHDFRAQKSTFWSSTLHLEALETLELEDVALSGSDLGDTLLEVFTRISTLRLTRVRLTELSTVALQDVESALKDTELQGCFFDLRSLQAICRLLKISASLRSLVWGVWTMVHEKGQTAGTSAPIAGIVKNGAPWQNLKKLDMYRLQGYRTLQAFKAFNQGVSDLVLRQVVLNEEDRTVLLDNFAVNLTRIEFESCEGLESLMIHRLLCSCRNLLTVSVDVPLLVSSVKQSSEQWCCTRLQEWRISIEMDHEEDDDDDHRHIFDRLCHLQELQVLNVSSTYARLDTDASFLRFGHEAGFRALGALENLKVLNARHTRQELRRADWEWLLATFRSLKKVAGFRVASEEEVDWRDALLQRAISYSR